MWVAHTAHDGETGKKIQEIRNLLINVVMKMKTTEWNHHDIIMAGENGNINLTQKFIVMFDLNES